MTDFHFEQGPIRPPSEAQSLLLRLTRNCPWNRCEFCHTYKGQKFSLRTVEEVKNDIDAAAEIAQELKALSWRLGEGGEITANLVRFVLESPEGYPDAFRNIALWIYSGGKNVFLQDANSLVLKTEQMVDVLTTLKETFPTVERITTYARSKTISKKSVEALRSLHRAGLSRIHIGLETGYDPLLEHIQKGVTAENTSSRGGASRIRGFPSQNRWSSDWAARRCGVNTLSKRRRYSIRSIPILFESGP